MKVLLIDDEKDIRDIGLLSLKAIGKFDARASPSPVEGIQEALSFKPDLIVMDMLMPGMDGLTALGQMRASAELAAIPVIFMTARLTEAEKEKYRLAGALGVVEKPFDPMTLPTQIRAILGAKAG